MMSHRLGERAVLVDLDTIAEVHALTASVRRRPPEGLVDLVPASRTLLLTLHTPGQVGPALEHLRRLSSAGVPEPAATAPVELPTVYDGPDLTDVGRLTGLGADEVVRRHAAAEYVVSFIGFAPGFAYLGPLDSALQVPRLATPRTRVPAGSVAVAEDSTAVYPTASPGGWRLLGRTAVVLFDASADPPALLTAGVRVRFVPVATL